nr:uncharacterized protein LOC105472428 [Macaca nemestrina]
MSQSIQFEILWMPSAHSHKQQAPPQKCICPVFVSRGAFHAAVPSCERKGCARLLTYLSEPRRPPRVLVDCRSPGLLGTVTAPKAGDKAAPGHRPLPPRSVRPLEAVSVSGAATPTALGREGAHAPASPWRRFLRYKLKVLLLDLSSLVIYQVRSVEISNYNLWISPFNTIIFGASCIFEALFLDSDARLERGHGMESEDLGSSSRSANTSCMMLGQLSRHLFEEVFPEALRSDAFFFICRPAPHTTKSQWKNVTFRIQPPKEGFFPPLSGQL